MNKVIETLKTHRSYRHFDETYTIGKEELQNILDASRQAPSWMNGQAYSIIVVDDKEKKAKLAEMVPGNPQIGTCSVFMLYLMDMRRMEVASEINNQPYAVCNDLDSLLITGGDAALAMQNAVVAAESLGYGTVIIGSVRKVAKDIIDMFKLPPYVYPYCGLCIGKPNIEMNIKPRLPEKAVVFYNEYNDADFKADLKEYDRIMEEFAEARETKLWTVKFADFHSVNCNPMTIDELKRQKYID